MDDPFNLQRFVDAQEPVYDQVLAELRAGRKTTHWIWFIFPQAKGLGRSARSELYGIGSLDEARAYLAHPILGPRLKECLDLVMSHEGLPLEDILGAHALAAEPLLALAASAEVAARYVMQSQEAIARGVFGAPTYAIGEELFWGQDRLDFVERALARAA